MSGHRVDAATVQYVERLIGGDPATERCVLVFIRARYGAGSLAELPQGVVKAILARPQRFVEVAREYVEPSLALEGGAA